MLIARWWHGPKKAGELWHKDRWVRSFDNTKIRYTLLGRAGQNDAPTVALCAGFVCPDTYWKYVVPALTDRFRVVVWNYRGIGVSELPRAPGFHAYAIDDEDLTIEANARDLECVLDHAGIEHAALIGHSMGVQVVLESYRRLPQHVDAIVCIAGPYRSPLRTFYRTDLSARLAPLALPLLHMLPRVTLFGWRALLRNPLAYPLGVRLARAIGPRAQRDDMQGYFEHLSMLDPLIVAKMVRGMHAHSAEDVLAKIDVPVLILHGTSDPFTPLSIAEEMEREIPNAKLVTYEGGAHTLPIEFREEVGAEIRRFLTETLSRS